MKNRFLFMALAAAVLAFAACTEKENVNTGDDTPEVPQHNSLYQTTWAGTSQQTVSVPILGSVTVTVDNTVNFTDDSAATSYVNIVAGSLVSLDSTLQCTYTWNDPNGVLSAVDNPQMNTAFTKVSDNTINITIHKTDMTAMWPAMGIVSDYLPESFSINLIKQE